MEYSEAQQMLKSICFRLTRRVPFASIIFDALEIRIEVPTRFKHISFLTDGTTLYVNELSLEHYKDKDTQTLETQLLHELLHVYFGHPAFADGKDRASYDAKCNQAVEMWIEREYSKEAFPMYKAFPKEEDRSHRYWYQKDLARELRLGGIPNAQDVYQQVSTAVNLLNSSVAGEEKQDLMAVSGIEPGTKNVGVNNETSVQMGEKYRQILKEYIQIQEVPCNSDEEIDTMLYTYGLELYKDVTFVEPPETTEQPVAHFFMAIDVSGSCVEGVIEKFVGQTKEVIREMTDGGRKSVDIYLLLCDSKIQQEIHITDFEDFPQTKDLHITGGGTDFRPVFTRIGEILKKSRSAEDTALFYYTDGMGVYPEDKPVIPTYFLMEELNEYQEIPDWVKVLRL